MAAVSLLCVLILTGGYIYSGSVVPITGEGTDRDAVTWAMWMVIVGIPITTIVLFALKLLGGS